MRERQARAEDHRSRRESQAAGLQQVYIGTTMTLESPCNPPRSMRPHLFPAGLLFAWIMVFMTPVIATPQAVDSTVAAARSVRVTRLQNESNLFRKSFSYGVTSPKGWTVETATRIAGAGALVIVLSSQDDALRDVMSRNQSSTLDAVESVVEPLGMKASFPIIGGFLLTGVIFDEPRAAAVGAEALASSLIAAGIITPTIKLVVGRARPRADHEPYTFDPFSGAQSFPSGHTTQAFAIASVIAGEYDSPWIQVSAYGLASLVGIARMYMGAHFISDVAAGAMIGTTVGTAIVRHAGRSGTGEGSANQHVRLEPLLTRNGGAGVQLRIRIPQDTQ